MHAKPPLGPTPRWVHENRRRVELMRAIVEYDTYIRSISNEGEHARISSLMSLWLDELKELLGADRYVS